MLKTASHDPSSVGLSESRPTPCSLIILGGAGDLAKRKLLPAAYNLALDDVLPGKFAIFGFARRDFNDKEYRAFARKGVDTYSRQSAKNKHWDAFEQSIYFVNGSFEDPEAFTRLKERLEEVEAERGLMGNRIFYLSIPPSAIEVCVNQLKMAGLIYPYGESKAFSRVIVEKPIGRDLESANQVNATLAQVLDEKQIFRIDHYLGKETVQNIMVMRFGNSIFEPLWNQKYIDHVQITVAEEEGVGTRAGYFEHAGSLRDMVQNHILQLLSLTAMEPPWAISGDIVRDNKLAVLNCLRPFKNGEKNVIRAQYAAGMHNGIKVPGYRREENVQPHSITETYVALKVYIDNWRWSGVPFFLRTGKRMPKRVSEIAVQFKDIPPILFNADPQHAVSPNVLTLRIQPDEGLSMSITTKLPGSKLNIKPVEMDFRYQTSFDEESPEAYERLLLDVMVGDPTLFMRRDEVEASWRWIKNIQESWAKDDTQWLPEYVAGSAGPVEADKLINNKRRKWRTL